MDVSLEADRAPEWSFSDAEIVRYSRNILLPELGAVGQARLKAARVLVVGAGGLGSPLALYLAAAGVGRLTIVDHDRVELSNLQRQVLHDMHALGRNKAASAAERLARLNDEVRVEVVEERLTAANVAALVAAHDLACDGTDNFPTRFLLADACVLGRRTLVSAAAIRFEGQLSVFKPHVGGPCYRCLNPAAPPEGLAASCAEAGILGAVTGVLGCLQATETIKEIAGIGESLAGRLLLWDALASRMRTIALPADPDCPLCGPRATIRDLSAHAG